MSRKTDEETHLKKKSRAPRNKTVEKSASKQAGNLTAKSQDKQDSTVVKTQRKTGKEPEQDLPSSQEVSMLPDEHSGWEPDWETGYYMNPNQQAYFRRILLQWKQQLLIERSHTVHHLQDEATALPDLTDRATQEEEFSLELRTRNRERKLIKKIEETLEKLDQGKYGYCEICGIEIGIKRLEARPTANLCIDCKTLEEIQEK